MLNHIKKITWNLFYRIKPFKGKERLASFLSRPKKINQILIKRQGVNWHLYGHDLNEFSIAIRQNHSYLLSKNLEKQIKENNIQVFWDIGANIGGISLPLLKKFNQLHAFLFEPSAEVAGRLIQNLSNNPELCKRTKIMNIALSNSSGISDFFVSNETLNSGVAGLAHSKNRLEFSIGIQTYTGDSLIESKICPPPQLIKIDVEGFELEVFMGLKNTLMQYHPIIFFEHSFYRFIERNQPYDSVTNFLISLGYSIYELKSNNKISYENLNKEVNVDFIAKI